MPRAPLFFAAKSQKNYFLKGNWAGESELLTDRYKSVEIKEAALRGGHTESALSGDTDGCQMLGWLDSEQKRCDSSLCDSRKRKDYTNDGGASGWLLTPCCVSFSHTHTCLHSQDGSLSLLSHFRVWVKLQLCSEKGVRTCVWVSEWVSERGGPSYTEDEDVLVLSV